MRLYLARHGEAGFDSVDANRCLTTRGIMETRETFRCSAECLPEQIKTLFCSPLLRARQTADIALEMLPLVTDEVNVVSWLTPDTSFSDLCSAPIGEHQWPVMLVGHQPFMGTSPKLKYSVPTSVFFALDIVALSIGCGSLCWQFGSI